MTGVYLFTVFIIEFLFGILCTAGQSVGPMKPGHLKRFGEGRPNHRIDSVQNWPENVPAFFERHVKGSRPLKFAGAAKLSPAFEKWTDDYFLALDGVPTDYAIGVESRKKENRSIPTTEMGFQDFVKIYNKTDQYMVNAVPPFLEADVSIPGPLQCEVIYKDNPCMVESIMWFSSGGTKSVVHTDSGDNIICLYRGEKEFVLVDPHVYGDKVDLDRPEGAYSSIDVDRVDYTKFPGLAEVEYYHTNLTAGDCLYIPYKWIHQVRSYGSNIAVNIWWNHYLSLKLDLSSCSRTTFDPHLAFNALTFTGFDALMNTKEQVRDHLLDVVKRNQQFLTYDSLAKTMTAGMELEELKLEIGIGFEYPIKKVFEQLDANQDGGITKQELMAASDEDWEAVSSSLQHLQAILQSLDDEEEGQGEVPPHEEL